MTCLLRANGADCNVSDPSGKAPLHYHAIHGEKTEEEPGGFNLDANDPANGLLVQLRAQHRESRARARAHTLRMRAAHRAMQTRLEALGRGRYGCYVEPEPQEQPEMGDGTIVSALIHSGAQIDLRDKRGSTPLFYAAGAGQLPIVVALLQAGANPNLRGELERMTPLHNTMVCRRFDIVSLCFRLERTPMPLTTWAELVYTWLSMTLDAGGLSRLIERMVEALLRSRCSEAGRSWFDAFNVRRFFEC